MTIYRSKIGFEIAAPVILITGAVLFVSLLETEWLMFSVLLIVALFVSHLFFTTYYEIDGAILKIKCGFLYRKQLPIHSIVKLVETNNPMSAPAVSLDRLEIFYNRFDSVLVSPKNKKDFIQQLRDIHPEITVELKQNG